MSDSRTRATVVATLGMRVRYALMPATTGVPAVGAVVTTGAGAWGAYKDIVAANAITVEFWVCGYYFDTITNVQVTTLEHNLTTGGPTYAILGYSRIDPTAATPNLGFSPIGPYPIRMNPNANIQCRGRGAAAKVCGVSLLYAVTLV